MAQRQTLSDYINTVASSAALAVDPKAKAMKAAGLDVVGFGAGESNFPTPVNVVKAAVDACLDPENYEYTSTPDLPELREAITVKMLRDSGYEVNADQVVVTNGGKQAVYEPFQILLNDSDEVIIPAPYWTSYLEAVKFAGGVPAGVPAGADVDFEPSFEALEAVRTEYTKAIIVNSPSNPTGAVWKPETVEAIGRWVVEHHTWAISDKIYGHLDYDDACTTYIGAAVPECHGQLLVLNGVAKTYAMPSWCVGWMVAPFEVAKVVAKPQDHMISNVANISQCAVLAAVAGPLDEVHEMRKVFDARRRVIMTVLNDIEGANCPTPAGVFYVFADITILPGKPLGLKGTVSDTSADFAAVLLDEAHVAAVPGEALGTLGYLHSSYALVDEDLAEGMCRFKEWAN